MIRRRRTRRLIMVYTVYHSSVVFSHQQVHVARYGLVQILTLVLLNPDIPYLCKQCISRSVGFCLHCLQLSMWIYTRSLSMWPDQLSRSSNLISWKWEVGVAAYSFSRTRVKTSIVRGSGVRILEVSTVRRSRQHSKSYQYNYVCESRSKCTSAQSDHDLACLPRCFAVFWLIPFSVGNPRDQMTRYTEFVTIFSSA